MILRGKKGVLIALSSSMNVKEHQQSRKADKRRPLEGTPLCERTNELSLVLIALFNSRLVLENALL